jgi:toxin ParE1/3/4
MIAGIFRTKAAISDLDQQAEYIQRDSPDAAIRFLAAAEAAFQRLAAMPELGQRQEFERRELAGLRVWQVQGFESHLIFYRPVERGIEVIRVLHAARDIAAIFDDPA